MVVTKEVFYNAAAFTLSYLILNYLLPNDNLNYFTKSFFITSGVIASGWTNNFIYKKATGGKKPLFGLVNQADNIKTTAVDILCEKDDVTEVVHDFDIGNYILSLIYDNKATILNISFSKFGDELKLVGKTKTDDRCIEVFMDNGKLFLKSKEFLVIQMVIIELNY